jgi:uncharacterized membrane protein YdjX (TVP38/TMEM64 family)
MHFAQSASLVHKVMHMRTDTVENYKLILWVIAVIGFCVVLNAVPNLSDPTLFSHWIRADSAGFWMAWIALQATCAVFMVPTLPLVIAAALVLPNHKPLVLVMSLLGVLASAIAIYRNAAWLGLKQRWSTQPRLVVCANFIREHGFLGLMLWCAAPFLPSDLGCYVAASAGMPRGRYLLAVLCGEAVLCGSIIYGVGTLLAS